MAFAGVAPLQFYVRIVTPVGKPRPHVRREDELTEVTCFMDDSTTKPGSSPVVPVHKASWFNSMFNKPRAGKHDS